MLENTRKIQLGTATITSFHTAEYRETLAEMLTVPDSERPLDYSTVFEQTLRLPTHCILIQLPTATMLVDANVYDLEPSHPLALPDYQPPPGLLRQLTEADVVPDKITHVIFTHAHFDHFNGATHKVDGHYVPCFPNARHYLGRADWENADTQKALLDPQSLESRTLGVLHQKGLLELVDARCSLQGAVEIIPAPGETNGHQIVRISSAGQTLYCLGDLYHHPVEVEHPAWMSSWAMAEANLMSRHALAETALAENALLVATHIPGVGRLERSASGVVWRAVN